MKLPFCSRSRFLTAFTRKLCISAVVPAFLPRLHDSFIFLQSFLLFYHVYTKALYFCSRYCFFSAFTKKLCIPAVVTAFFPHLQKSFVFLQSFLLFSAFARKLYIADRYGCLHDYTPWRPQLTRRLSSIYTGKARKKEEKTGIRICRLCMRTGRQPGEFL